MEKVCTSVNLHKACRMPEELGEGRVGRGGAGGLRARPEPPCPSDSSTEALTLRLTEVVKRQNSKSKKGFNQVRAAPGEQRACVCMRRGVRGLGGHVGGREAR